MKIVFCIYSVSQIRFLIDFVCNNIEIESEFISFNESKAVNDKISIELDKLGKNIILFIDCIESLNIDENEIENKAIDLESAWQPCSTEINYRKILLKQIIAAENLLKKLNPDFVIVTEDGPGGCQPIISKSKSLNITVLDLPFGIGEQKDYDNFIEIKAESKELNIVPDSTIGENVYNFAAEYIKETKFGPILLFPAEFVLALKATGLNIPRPWVVHGGNADSLIVESNRMEDIYLANGVDKQKLLKLGSPYADSALKNFDKFSSPTLSNPPQILVALPPSYHDVRAKYCEFKTYKKAIIALINSVREILPNAEIKISIHPGTNTEDRIYLQRQFKEETEWIVHALSKYDIFVTCFSSTIRWALFLGMPVVNYDIYSLNLDTYIKSEKVMVQSNSIGRIKKKLHQRIGNDGLFSFKGGHSNYKIQALKFNRWVAEIAPHREHWGISDGQNGQRIFDYLNTLDRSSNIIANNKKL